MKISLKMESISSQESTIPSRKKDIMSNPLALATIALSRSVIGSELMVAVKKLSDSGSRFGNSFAFSHRLEDGELFTIGQSSQWLWERLLVAPSKEMYEIRPDNNYSQVL